MRHRGIPHTATTHDEAPWAQKASALIAGAVLFAVFVLLCLQIPTVIGAGEVIQTHITWVPEIGLNLDLRLDALSLLFALLISGMGVLVVLYGHGYLHHDDSYAKFYTLLMVFAAAMLGIAISDNLLLLIVFWELTSISSFLLIGYWQHKAESRHGARMALTMTGGGGLAMLGGFVLLGHMAGTYQISALPAVAAQILSQPAFPIALVLILIGCFTKSAQWPFQFWLPNAMAAPTPVSAYLHSATMVKAGIFLLLRLHPVLGDSPLFQGIVTLVGASTLLFAAAVAIFKHDLKGLLAYSTISHLGLIVCLIGISTPLAIAAALLHILNHACFKAALFMTAGIVDHQSGTRDMRTLGALWRFLPFTATAAMLAAAGMAGVPPFNGFISKEMFLTEVVTVFQQHSSSWWLLLAASLGALLSVAYTVRLIHDTFVRPGSTEFMAQAPHNSHLHDPTWDMRLPVLLLAALCILCGLFPDALQGSIVRAASAAVLHTPTTSGSVADMHLALWHGFNLPLLISLLALLGGGLLYRYLAGAGNLHSSHIEAAWGRLGGAHLFDACMDRLFALSGRITHWSENGSLQRYLALLIAATLAAILWPVLQSGAVIPGTGTRPPIPASAFAILVWALVLSACALLVWRHHQRILSIVWLSVVGLAVVLVFVVFSSPDLALTQISVEVVSAVLLFMGLALLPQTTPREAKRSHILRDAALALAVGITLGWLSWVMLTRPHDSISWYFLQNALPKGGGTNVVNVILVDFRGYDTLGEITVLTIAALGVTALMQGLRVQRSSLTHAPEQGWSFPHPSLLLRSSVTWLLPLALTVSLYIFLRGHNLPGGGFIAGLISAVALVMHYMAHGQHRAEADLHAQHGTRYIRSMAIGLLAACGTGLGAVLLGYPFLTSASGHPTLPVLGEIPLASAALFDLGVYLVVVGGVMLTLSVLGRATPAHTTAPSPKKGLPC